MFRQHFSEVILTKKATWEVTYSLETPIPVVGRRDAEPLLDLRLTYDQSGSLCKAVHTVLTAPLASDVHIITTSERTLSTYWDAISFCSGVRARFAPMTAQRLDVVPAGIDLRVTMMPVQISAVIVRRMKLPNVQRLRAAPSRLPVWLSLAIQAHEASSDADALRSVFMILEDLYSGMAKVGNGFASVKHARDFCSHGRRLTSPGLLRYLKREFKRPVDRFDPNDPSHQGFVRRMRSKGQEMVNAELLRFF